MTIGELLEHLKDKDPSMRVFVNGYEGDIDDAVYREIKVSLNKGMGGYFGKHGEYSPYADWDETSSDPPPVEGVLLGRY